MPKKWISPAEHEEMLNDPSYKKMREAKEAAQAERVEQRVQEMKPLLEDLATIGVIVDQPSRLLQIPELDERVYPVLLKHLTRSYNPWLVESIGRAFGRKPARPIVWDNLIELLRSHSLAKAAVEGVMVAISEMAKPSDLPTLIDLLSDRSIGSSRIYLVRNLMRSKKPEARAALLRNQDDPDLVKEISARLDRSRA